MASGKPRRSAKTVVDIARKAPTRTLLRRHLIVCEGSKTEPQYFKDLVKDLRLTTADVVVCGEECSSDPVSVVNYAVSIFRLDGDFDSVFCVMDRDSHTNMAEAQKILVVENATTAGKFWGIISVPCFEYWVFLHFEYTTAPYARTQRSSPCDHVILKLKKKYLPDYQKGSKGLYELLKPHLSKALRHSEMSDAAAKANNTDNPTTQISFLIKALHVAVAEAAPKIQLSPVIF